jgi:PHD/YefM family antitoxin component YafN of YafNO toxin-antitoxin module
VEAQLLDTGVDILPLSDFASNASDLLQQMRGSGHPVVLTINGKAELVVQDAASYQKLLDRVDELEALDAIKRGAADFDAGRVTLLSDFERVPLNPSKSTIHMHRDG